MSDKSAEYLINSTSNHDENRPSSQISISVCAYGSLIDTVYSCLAYVYISIFYQNCFIPTIMCVYNDHSDENMPQSVINTTPL